MHPETEQYIVSRTLGYFNSVPSNALNSLEEVTDNLLKGRLDIIHEKITVNLSGYEHNDSIHGYDGICPQTGTKIEVKSSCINIPQNPEYYVRGRFKGLPKPSRKFEGHGIYSSYTRELFDRHAEENIHVLCSGFAEGRLLYILQFPFHYRTFYNHLQVQVDDTRKNLHFNFKHYENCPDLKAIFKSTQGIKDYERFFNGNFLKLINNLDYDGFHENRH